jgi:hypothetical protein
MWQTIVANNFKSILVTVAATAGAMCYALVPKQNAYPTEAKAPAPAVQPAVSYGAPTQYLPASAPAFAPPTQETLSFQVLSVGRSAASGMTYLNSAANFRMPGCNSIKLTPGVTADANQYIGKTVTASGPARATQTGGREVTISNPAALSVR